MTTAPESTCTKKTHVDQAFCVQMGGFNDTPLKLCQGFSPHSMHTVYSGLMKTSLMKSTKVQTLGADMFLQHLKKQKYFTHSYIHNKKSCVKKIRQQESNSQHQMVAFILLAQSSGVGGSNLFLSTASSRA